MYRIKIDVESDEVSMCLMWDPVGRSLWKIVEIDEQQKDYFNQRFSRLCIYCSSNVHIRMTHGIWELTEMLTGGLRADRDEADRDAALFPTKMCPGCLRTRVVTAGSPWGATC